MFKKILIILFGMIFVINTCFANVLPQTTSDIPNSTIGVYQTENKLIVYKEPSKESKIIFELNINYNNYINKYTDNNLAIVIPHKQLGYVFVTDCDEDWVEIIYDKKLNLKGWVQKEDDFQFLPWITFYNMYGRKYGLVKLRNTTNNINDVYSQPDEKSQVIGKSNQPKQIRMTSIEGNWMLVSILDITNNTYTGYIQWRNINGEYYIFPNIK